MPDVNVYDAFRELIDKLLSGDTEVAELAASDPEGLLAAYGITEAELDGVDFRQVVGDAYQEYDLPEGCQEALRSYTAGESAPAEYGAATPPPYSDGYQSAGDAAQHLQYVTYAAYEQNEEITQEIVNKQLIDQSDNRSFEIENRTDLGVDVGGDLDGDITVAPATAAGDGAIANTGADAGPLTAGDGNQVADVDIDTGGGDGGSADGTGGEAGFRFGNDANGTGGDASGGAGGDVGPVNLNFGSGDQGTTEIDGDVEDSALAFGDGDAGNVSDNRVDDGSALSADGDARGSQFDRDPIRLFEQPAEEAFAEQEALGEQEATESAVEAELIAEPETEQAAVAEELPVEELATAEPAAEATEEVVGG